MGENTKIEWAHHTFNPWMGCTKVSEGCKHCYAEQQMDKHYKKVQWGTSGKRLRTSKDNWRKPIQWNKWAKERGIRYRVFCASLADVFEDKPDQPEMDDWRADLMRLISATPNLDWLLLTKRPENVISKINKAIKLISSDDNAADLMVAMEWLGWVKHGSDYALPNVWIGTSVENQEAADKRIPELLKIPAKVRFLSMEPLLSNVDIGHDLVPSFASDDPRHFPKRNGIEWVIAGGESGSHARPMHPDWVRSIRDQCVTAGVPFLFKQWGEYGPQNDLVPDTSEIKEKFVTVSPKGFTGKSCEYPVAIGMWRIGKARSGRLLDGVEWNQFPV
jgi:protein gp37